MAKLNVDQKTVKDLFQAKQADFLIPDYQRPYSWGERECQRLWDDIFQFAIPDGDGTKFDRDSEYYLGAIVTFKNENGKQEVIDGQQRLTTLMLLLRAFYAKFGHMQDEKSVSTRQNLEKCLWKTDEFGKPDMEELKIDSEVIGDDVKGEFLEILRSGEAKEDYRSRYAENYRFFQEHIDEFLGHYPDYFGYFPTRIMNNCILLPIEAGEHNTALRIFSTLNDRGMPLEDADIFKAKLYNFYSQIGKKEEFIDKWRNLSDIWDMNWLFGRNMYFERAKMGVKDTTVEGLRNFYEKNNYALLKKEETLDNLIAICDFWVDVLNQDGERFSNDVLRRFFVIDYAPNRIWADITSVYFLQNRDEEGRLDDGAFCAFLDKITGFILAYTITNSGVGVLFRAPLFAEMISIVGGKPVTFSEYKFSKKRVRDMFSNISFNNNRPITRSMVTWWAFQNKRQELLTFDYAENRKYAIEHIYAVNRYDQEQSLENPDNLESLGNKALLERKVNIRASDYRFNDKKKYYLGFTNGRGQKKAGTKNAELIELARTKNDFTEQDIEERYKKIVDGFIAFLGENDLLK